MPTLTDLKIDAPQLCRPLDDKSWYDLTSGPRARLSDPLLLADGSDGLNARFSEKGNALVDRIEALLHCRFHGIHGELHLRVAQPAGHIVSGENFVEALLGSAQRIDRALRNLTLPLTGTYWTSEAEEKILAIIDGVRDGKVDAPAFMKLMAQPDFVPDSVGYHLLFARNGHMLVEQTRTAMLRVFDHADRMMAEVKRLLKNTDGRYYLPLSVGEEIFHASPTAERVHGAFADGISGIATTLDLLYRLFVYLVREPFGSPELPGKLHFPYNEAQKAYAPYPKGAGPDPSDRGPAELPYALPNAVPGNFFALRGVRNDLTHNMTSGHIQPICWIGRGTPFVSKVPIHYVQAVTPDVDSDGKPVKHAFVERFFGQQRDAAGLLRELIEELALTVDHTLRWLAHRLEQRLRHMT
ncbi:hypothetical protein RFM26_08585 [Mesorhizobium sp. VK23B]|uniref:Uncharacterized protein n=1 Tax=Mesorhizobium dulcispinae TaxID=3072316 RepID=A0ABU4X9I4_9HYPH|nr:MULTISPECIES: hypothetical protein [unclassified Mesorhizobium]MDX8465738.1 hypothetical protein [Mesorhizobium sp. VK23B]MDX8471460.1 hypothetical protein [Mesorhizobium sp. VK23A]